MEKLDEAPPTRPSISFITRTAKRRVRQLGRKTTPANEEGAAREKLGKPPASWVTMATIFKSGGVVLTEESTQISIEDFMSIELRVGKVLTCVKVPKSRKLLKMEIDLGKEVRQILAGLSQHYLPEEMVGRRVVVVANLKPATLMGLESQGMVLAADPGSGGGVPALVNAPEGVALGTRVR